MSNDILSAFAPKGSPPPWFWRDPWIEWSYLKSLPEPERTAALEAWNDILALWNHYSILPAPTDAFLSHFTTRPPKDGERELWEALERMASRFVAAWRVYNPDVRRALREEADENGQTTDLVKQGTVRTGLILALAEAARPQRIRIGERWIHLIENRRVLFTTDRAFRDLDTGESGTLAGSAPALIAECPPISLPLVHLERWLRRETVEAAEATLLDKPYPPVAADALDRAERADPEQMELEGPSLVDALDALGEPQKDAWSALQRILTPKQGELLERLVRLQRLGFELPEAKRLAATIQDREVGAIDKALSRIRRRV